MTNSQTLAALRAEVETSMLSEFFTVAAETENALLSTIKRDEFWDCINYTQNECLLLKEFVCRDCGKCSFYNPKGGDGK